MFRSNAEEIGVLDVNVYKAEGLKKMDITGLCDAYVVCMVANIEAATGKTQKTNFIRQNLNPEWNHSFTFPVYSLKHALHVKVFDHDDLGSDDMMGQCKIVLESIAGEDVVDWFMLRNEGEELIIGEDGSNSRVRVGLQYTPHPSKEKAILAKPIYTGGEGELIIIDAVRKAAGTEPKRRVLLQLGSDWNFACKKMHHLLSEDPVCSALADKFYEYVLVDAEAEGNEMVLKKLGDPQYLGFPVFVILDSTGRYIHTQATGALEQDPILTCEEPDAGKVARFLNHWKEGGQNDEDPK